MLVFLLIISFRVSLAPAFDKVSVLLHEDLVLKIRLPPRLGWSNMRLAVRKMSEVVRRGYQ